jgi:hypothetical protein
MAESGSSSKGRLIAAKATECGATMIGPSRSRTSGAAAASSGSCLDTWTTPGSSTWRETGRLPKRPGPCLRDPSSSGTSARSAILSKVSSSPSTLWIVKRPWAEPENARATADWSTGHTMYP